MTSSDNPSCSVIPWTLRSLNASWMLSGISSLSSWDASVAWVLKSVCCDVDCSDPCSRGDVLEKEQKNTPQYRSNRLSWCRDGPKYDVIVDWGNYLLNGLQKFFFRVLVSASLLRICTWRLARTAEAVLWFEFQIIESNFHDLFFFVGRSDEQFISIVCSLLWLVATKEIC